MPFSKKINKDFFKSWSNDVSYILGFLFADGEITENKRGAYYFTFHSSDNKFLQEIKKKMDSGHKISRRKDNVYRLQIGSKEMVNDLKVYGLYPKKTKRIRLPIIPKKFVPAFICGFFDGDGNVWVGYNNTQKHKGYLTIQTSFTSASFDFLKDLKNILQEYGIIGGSLFNIKNKQCGRLTFSVQDSLKLYEIMYNKAKVAFCLNRKKLVFERYIKMRA